MKFDSSYERSNTNSNAGACRSFTRRATSVRRKGAARDNASTTGAPSPPPNGITNTLACLRSGDARTSVTVIGVVLKIGSRIGARANVSVSASRRSSPTRNWR
ncbi:uncharacterized protein METZ01_LOCUS311558 [marine metagenome]|uniref:Uncharacterized protein n=1 Tax=marine metagenome TaxID=408172 RepID=A0A382NBW8_9ZZZZ